MRHQIHDLLAPLPGTARQIHSFHFGPEQATGKVYIQSSLHADELPGMLVAWHLKQRLAELEAAGRLRSEIVLVPIANPVGLEQVLMDMPLGRYELESGQNFNRRFVDLSEEVGNAIEGQLGDDPQHNVELIRTHPAPRPRRPDRQHPTAIPAPDPATAGLRCRHGAGPALRFRIRGAPVHHARSLAAGRTAGALYRSAGQPAGHRLRRAVVR